MLILMVAVPVKAPPALRVMVLAVAFTLNWLSLKAKIFGPS